MRPALPSPLGGWMRRDPGAQSLPSIRPTRRPPFTWPQQSWRLRRGDHGFAALSFPTAVASCPKAAVLRSWTAARSSAPSVWPAVAGPSRTSSAARPPSLYWRAPDIKRELRLSHHLFLHLCLSLSSLQPVEEPCALCSSR